MRPCPSPIRWSAWLSITAVTINAYLDEFSITCREKFVLEVRVLREFMP